MAPKFLKIQQKTGVALTVAIAVSVAAVGFAAAAIVMNLLGLRSDTSSLPLPPTATINACLCGNGSVEEGETCDDSNRIGGDGCGVNCMRETDKIMINGRQVWKSCANLSLNLNQRATIKINRRNHTFSYERASRREALATAGTLVIDRTNRQTISINKEFAVDGQIFQMLSANPLVIRLGNNRECVVATCVSGALNVGVRALADFNGSNQDIVLSNVPGVVLGEFEFDNSANDQEIEVRNIRIKINNTTNTDENPKVFSNLKLYKGETLLASLGRTSTGGSFMANFGSNPFILPANGKETLIIKGDAGTIEGAFIKEGDGFSLGLISESAGDFSGVVRNSSGTVQFNLANHEQISGKYFHIFSAYPSVKFSNDTPSGAFRPGPETLLAKLDVKVSAGANVAIKKINFNAQVTSTADCSGIQAWTLKELPSGRILANFEKNISSGTVNFDLTAQPLNFIVNTTGSLAVSSLTKKLGLYTNTDCLGREGDSIMISLNPEPKDNFAFSYSLITRPEISNLVFNKADVIFGEGLMGGLLVR